MAETYRVLNWRELPLVTAATLAQGLPSSSRTKRRISGAPEADNVQLLLAVIADRVGHESIDITFRYAHMFPTVQKEMANKLNEERSA